MSPAQLKRREALLDRKDALVEQWPGRTSPEFIREMTDVVQELEAIARDADASRVGPIERSRN